MTGRVVDHTGKVFGLLTATKFLRTEKVNFLNGDKNIHIYICRDIFGGEAEVKNYNFYLDGFGKHLINKESIAKRARLKAVYNNMLIRCYDKSYRQYKNYGGREVGVCEEWKNKKTGFVNFMCWCVANGWRPGLSIDRVENNLGYNPKNCRIISRSENAKYKTTTRLSEEKGARIRKLYMKWKGPTKKAFCVKMAAKFNVKPATIYSVLINRNWTNKG